MKIIVNRDNLRENPAQFLRRAGYGFIVDRRRGTESFARRIGRGHYPRFHVYIKEAGDRIIFDMHLDQKQASYEGAHAHNAEYDGAPVEGEIDRLKGLLGIGSMESFDLAQDRRGTHKVKHKTQNSNISDIPSAEKKIGNRDVFGENNNLDKQEEKKGWFKKIFNF